MKKDDEDRRVLAMSCEDAGGEKTVIVEGDTEGSAVVYRARRAKEGQPCLPGKSLGWIEPKGNGLVLRGMTKGPAMVNSSEYRDNWTAIFGRRQEAGSA